MHHTTTPWHFDISVIYPKDFIVKFILQYFKQQQYLLDIAIQPTVGSSAYKLIYVVRTAHCLGENNCETGL